MKRVGYTMAKMLLNLRHVPEDEVIEVLQLLNEHDIDHYQVPPSAFMISAGSIWIKHDQEFDQALELFNEFQSGRAQQAQQDWHQKKAQGTQPGLLDALRTNPGPMAAYITIAILIVLFLLTPVVQLFR